MSAFDERMGQLRQRFLERAAADRDTLARAKADEDAAELRRIAHSLSGNGGLFGFDEISAAAHRLETALDDDASAQETGRLLRLLVAAIDQAL